MDLEQSFYFGPLWSLGPRLDWLLRNNGCCPQFSTMEKKKWDEWTETAQIAFISPPLDANYPSHASKWQGCRINNVHSELTSALRPPLQTSCHIWCSAEHADSHCGWANMDTGLRSGQIALLGVFARWGPWQISKDVQWRGWMEPVNKSSAVFNINNVRKKWRCHY